MEEIRISRWLMIGEKCKMQLHGFSDPSIQHSTVDCVWRYVPSLDDSAGIASRGCSAQVLAKSKLWWERPSWLKKEEMHWPQETKILENNEGELSHVRCEEKPITMSLTVKTKSSICINNIEIIDRIFNFGKMIRITAYVFRFIHNTKQLLRNFEDPLTKFVCCQLTMIKRRFSATIIFIDAIHQGGSVRNYNKTLSKFI